MALLAVLVALAALAAPAPAASTFDLSGTVLDESGVPLAGATLTLVHQSSGLTRRTETNDLGQYDFPGLPPGEYSLEARLEAFATSRFAGLRYFAGTKPIFNITLRLREVQESMTFTGEAPLLNVSQSQVGLSVEERQLQELPLSRREYLELVTLEGPARELREGTPGEPVFGAPLQTVNGANAHYTAYRLDGFQNTRDEHGVVHVDVSLQAIEEFRVVSGQFSAEYGRSLGGVVTAATKSGGNDFHGSLFAFVRPGGWDAKDPLTSENTALDRRDLGFTFSGPLRRERTHFFVSFEHRDQEQNVVVTAPFGGGRFRGLYELPSDRVRLLGKISHSFHLRHHLTATAIVADQSSLEGVGGFDVFQNALDTDNDDGAVYASAVSEIGPALSDLRVGFSSERFRASADRPPLGASFRHPLLGNVGNPTRSKRADEQHFEISDTLSFAKGSHGLKTGFSFLRIATSSELLRFEDGLFLFAPSQDPLDAFPMLYWQRAGASGTGEVLERDESHLQLFFQDDWQVSPYVALNLGLRWERESSVPDDDNLAPRLGFHWDATRDGRTSVRGGYGVYYSSVFSIVDTLERLYGPSGRGVVAISPASPGAPAENLYVEAPVHAGDARRSPYAQHWNVGMEREWAPTLSVALDVSYIRGSDLILPSDLNAPSFFDYTSGGARTPAEADATRPFGAPGLPIPPGAISELPDGFPFSGYRDLYLLASRGSSRFWGVRLTASKRYATSYMIQGTYQWSRTRNDGDDFRLESSLPLDTSRPDLEWARSATDVPHSLVLNGVWDAPYGLRLAGILRARSGRPLDPRVGVDLDGDLKLRERAFIAAGILERNSFRASSTAALDLSFARTWELGETRRLSASLDVFNLTNRLNPLQVLDTYGTSEAPLPSFLEMVQAASGRQFQVSVRFWF